MIGFVIESRIGYQSAFFTWQIDAKFIAKAHAHHVVAPSVHGGLHVLVFASVAYHIVQSPTEISVARRTDGWYE